MRLHPDSEGDAGVHGKLAKDMASPDTAPYVIRRMDAQAHILWDRATNTTGYLIFAPDKWSGGERREAARRQQDLLRHAQGRSRRLDARPARPPPTLTAGPHGPGAAAGSCSPATSS